MSAYDDLCREYFENEPRWIAMDRILQDLPMKMRQAISDYLAAPTGIANIPTFRFGRPTSYVDLYSPSFIDQNGKRSWERCENADALQLDFDGIYCFTIGVCMEKRSASLNASMIFFTFCIESFDEGSVALQIKNMAGSIRINDVNEHTSYVNAGKEAIDRIRNDLKTPRAACDSHTPIGFIVFSRHSLPK